MSSSPRTRSAPRWTLSRAPSPSRASPRSIPDATRTLPRYPSTSDASPPASTPRRTSSRPRTARSSSSRPAPPADRKPRFTPTRPWTRRPRACANAGDGRTPIESTTASPCTTSTASSTRGSARTASARRLSSPLPRGRDSDEASNRPPFGRPMRARWGGRPTSRAHPPANRSMGAGTMSEGDLLRTFRFLRYPR